MAYITKVSGGSQPVFATDVLNGNVAPTAAMNVQGPIQVAGPKLDFFSITANGNVSLQGAVNGYVANVLQAVQQTATVSMYQVAANGTTISFGVYPTGAYTSATFVAAVQTANTSTIGVPTGNVSTTASFTNLA
jgi:hypothetical protein